MNSCKRCKVDYEEYADSMHIGKLTRVVCPDCYVIEIKRFSDIAFGRNLGDIDAIMNEVISSIEECPSA